MNTSNPEEYITLKSGSSQNYFEIYDKTLTDQSKCRFGPRYGTPCSFCSNKTLENHGFTSFSKARFNITSMRIIGKELV